MTLDDNTKSSTLIDIDDYPNFIKENNYTDSDGVSHYGKLVNGKFEIFEEGKLHFYLPLDITHVLGIYK
jgi:hypothetical protein